MPSPAETVRTGNEGLRRLPLPGVRLAGDAHARIPHVRPRSRRDRPLASADSPPPKSSGAAHAGRPRPSEAERPRTSGEAPRHRNRGRLRATVTPVPSTPGTGRMPRGQIAERQARNRPGSSLPGTGSAPWSPRVAAAGVEPGHWRALFVKRPGPRVGAQAECSGQRWGRRQGVEGPFDRAEVDVRRWAGSPYWWPKVGSLCRTPHRRRCVPPGCCRRRCAPGRCPRRRRWTLPGRAAYGLCAVAGGEVALEAEARGVCGWIMPESVLREGAGIGDQPGRDRYADLCASYIARTKR